MHIRLKNFLGEKSNKTKNSCFRGWLKSLFRDGGFDGIVIKLGNEFAYTKLLSDGNIEAGAAL